MSWSHLQEDVPIGRWLESFAGPRAHIMDTGPTMAYYAGGSFSSPILIPMVRQLCATSAPEKWTFSLCGKHIATIALTSRSGIATRTHFELVKTFHEGTGNMVRIFRCSGTSSAGS